jgi:hypothetical protein
MRANMQSSMITKQNANRTNSKLEPVIMLLAQIFHDLKHQSDLALTALL